MVLKNILKKTASLPFYILKLLKWKYYSLRLGYFGENSQISKNHWFVNPQNIYIGKYCSIGPYCRIETYSDYGNLKTTPQLTIGDSCSIEHAVHIYCVERVEIQKGCLVASGCMITDNNHGTNPEGEIYSHQPLNAKPTIIKENVWLGENVCVLSGSVVGKRSIIGANSVVSGEIPDYSIAVGSPAKVIKKYNFESKKWEKVCNG